MKWTRRGIWAGIALVALLALAFTLYATLRNRPQDLPWTKLDLAEPIGLFTGRKMAGLGRDFTQCRALLDRAGVRYEVLPELVDGAHCGYADGVRFARGGPRRIDFLPADLKIACPAAAALSVWEWEVVQPAAIRHFGKRVSAIEHLGSYSCRHIVGNGGEGWSQHSTADAVDISAFRLADATRITVKRDWNGDPARAAFLREVRDGACRLFSITLSPDYNEAHKDHLHLDEAPFGEFGWRGCR
ncbi:MAG: extensin family protein [Pseudomonadota bacterium]